MIQDYRERRNHIQTAIQAALFGLQTQLWTAIPGIVQSYDPVAVTVVVQPTIQAKVIRPDNGIELMTLPLLPDVPVCFPRGGGYTLTFPIQPGDECLVIFSSRAIDAWWQQGGIQPPTEDRLHDLSDGFAVFGPQSQVNKITAISTKTTQLRSNDGVLFVELDSTNGAINVTSTAKVTVTGATVEINASNIVEVNTPLLLCSGDVVAGTISLQQHVHPDPQGGLTGLPQ